MLDNIEYGRERLKDNLQKRGKGRRDRRRREKIWERQTGENVNSTASKNERTIKDAYRRFVKSGKVKEDIDIYNIFQSSQTAYQSSNWVLAKGNANC